MQKRWYILYTRAGFEKKVSAHLTKKKIENFHPVTLREVVNLKKTRMTQEPIFPSYVFVHTEEEKLYSLKSIEHVLSILYLRDKPARLEPKEVQALREFTEVYRDIKIVKTGVRKYKDRSVQTPENNFQAQGGKVLFVKNRTLAITLPSIGYSLSAPVPHGDASLAASITITEENVLLQ